MARQSSDVLHALVVDDDFFVRAAAVDILEDAGFAVLEAEHGDAAYDLLKMRHPEIALLFTDVQVPGSLDGFALARRVAACWPHISIVVASGRAKPGPDSMPAKAHFIAKPFSAALIQHHLQRLNLNDQNPHSGT